MTIDDLKRILTASAGGDDSGLAGEILDTLFEDLGYDSLALIDSAGRIEREFGITLPDEQVAELATPRELLDLVGSTTKGSEGRPE